MTQRPTRWEKARSDSAGFKAVRREAASILTGGALGALLLWRLESDLAAIQQLIVVLAAAVGAAVLVPIGELGWNWLQAPMRLLTDDVVAMRRLLERSAAAGTSQRSVETTVDARTAAVSIRGELQRIGRELTRAKEAKVIQPRREMSREWNSHKDALAAHPDCLEAHAACSTAYGELSQFLMTAQNRATRRGLTVFPPDLDDVLPAFDSALRELDAAIARLNASQP